MPIFSETFHEVLDSTGTPTSKQKAYLDIHRDGDWHRGVHVWLVNKKGEILLQRRSMKVDAYPGMWENTAGGHIDSGDTSLRTAQKELQEELGILLQQEEFAFVNTIVDSYTYNNGAFINNEFDDIYLAYVDEVSVAPNEIEVAETTWIYFTELEKKITSHDPMYVPRDAEYNILFPLLHSRFDK